MELLVVIEEKSMIFNNNSSAFRELSLFGTLSFTTSQSGAYTSLQVEDAGSRSTETVPLAQIIVLEWAEGSQVIKQNKVLNTGKNVRIYGLNFSAVIVLRILKRREGKDNPCLPLTSPDDDLTVNIGDGQEKHQRSVTLDDLGIDMEMFMEFLANISPAAIETPILPNYKNALTLLKLADFFQMDWLKKRCEMHLINCPEIPLIDRFLLIDRYQLGAPGILDTSGKLDTGKLDTGRLDTKERKCNSESKQYPKIRSQQDRQLPMFEKNMPVEALVASPSSPTMARNYRSYVFKEKAERRDDQLDLADTAQIALPDNIRNNF